jgi:hypothetical protein
VLPSTYFDNITRYVRDGGALLIAAGPEFAGHRASPGPVSRPCCRQPGRADTGTALQADDHPRREPPSGRPRGCPARNPRRRPGASGCAPSGRMSDGAPRSCRERATSRSSSSPRGEGAGRAPPVRSRMALGARLQRWRAACRPAPPLVPLADEGTGAGGGGAPCIGDGSSRAGGAADPRAGSRPRPSSPPRPVARTRWRCPKAGGPVHGDLRGDRTRAARPSVRRSRRLRERRSGEPEGTRRRVLGHGAAYGLSRRRQAAPCDGSRTAQASSRCPASRPCAREPGSPDRLDRHSAERVGGHPRRLGDPARSRFPGLAVLLGGVLAAWVAEGRRRRA